MALSKEEGRLETVMGDKARTLGLRLPHNRVPEPL